MYFSQRYIETIIQDQASVMENERESQAPNIKRDVIGLGMKRLVLASGSLRRAEILKSVGWDFETLSADIDETLADGEDPVEYVERLSRQKAEASARSLSGELVLGADTTVVVDGDVLGKPLDDDDARRMLRRLSGRWHEVLTGVALVRVGENQKVLISHETTRVLFAELSRDEIDWYVATGEPMDKAGAYAIQGRAALFIEKIEGDYSNVVGLPVQLVYRLIREF